MGRWFAGFLKQTGHEIIITGRNREKLAAAGRELGVATSTDNVAAIREADAVLLSVNIDSFETICQQIGGHTRPEQVIIDLTSVKTEPVAHMHRYIKAGRVLGGHPVFGPGARDLTTRSLILTPTTPEETELAGKVKDYLEVWGARVSLMSPQAHDELMTVILGLAHFIAIVSADTLLSLEKLREIGEIGGVTFKLLLTLAESVVSEDPDFYAALQMSLPQLPGMEKDFAHRAGEWAELVAGGNKTEFAARMRHLKEKLLASTADFSDAYEDMYKVIDVLQKPDSSG